MSEKFDLSSEGVTKIKQAANEFKDTLLSYFKEHNVEIKEWKFAVSNSEESFEVDAAVKIVVKPKKTP